jgi:hypothetical protein
MGILDKVKEQADTLAHKAQQSVQQGQAKLDALQYRRAWDKAAAELGTAYFLAEKRDGSQAEVAEKLAVLERMASDRGLPEGIG